MSLASNRATSSALRTPEIVLLICDVISGSCSTDNINAGSDVKNRELCSLSSLARANRFISEIVLDVIWKELPSLDPLIKLLPIDVATPKTQFSRGRFFNHQTWVGWIDFLYIDN
jgi:hypothetical protein